jgi:hypothetical protein
VRVREVVALHPLGPIPLPTREAQAGRARPYRRARVLPVAVVEEVLVVGVVAQRKVVAREDKTLYPTVLMAHHIPAAVVEAYIAFHRRMLQATVAAVSCW